jgi:cellulose synthase/poly-beta-1,6-N-acetylglucosamine synthase-like glycosyltransferase
VLIPLHNEAAMVPQLYAAMAALDYPAERLDIKFVVEARSADTIAAVRAGLRDPRFSLVTVPDALPRTKPKALDFALPLCRGEHVVVFDAEDVPDTDQLWKAALRFRDDPDLVCLQARLVIDNGRRNVLAALFAGEYAGLFLVLLPALAGTCPCLWVAPPTIFACGRCASWAAGTPTTSPRTPISACALRGGGCASMYWLRQRARPRRRSYGPGSASGRAG